MNRFKAIGSAFLFVPALAFVSTQARAEFKCDEPQVTFDRAACEKAKESPDALRQYIQRIRDDRKPLVSGLRERSASAGLGARRGEPCCGQKSIRSIGGVLAGKPGCVTMTSLARHLNAAHFMRETLKIRSELRVFTLEKMGQPIEESVAL